MSQINDSLSNLGYLTTDDEDAGGCEGYIAPAAKLVFFILMYVSNFIVTWSVLHLPVTL